jgi:hypothetical protein
LLRNSNASSPVSPEKVQKINRVLVIGAGTMGTQIAVQCASHGRLVFLYDNIRAEKKENLGCARESSGGPTFPNG